MIASYSPETIIILRYIVNAVFKIIAISFTKNPWPFYSLISLSVYRSVIKPKKENTYRLQGTLQYHQKFAAAASS